LRTLVAHQELAEHPAGIGRPALFLEDERRIGRMNDPVVDLANGFGLEQQRFGLGTPDLAAASKLVADEHQHRLAGLGLRDAGQRRCRGHCQATRHQGPSVEHDSRAPRGRTPRAQYEEQSAASKAGLTVL
jgi:hypothetical protein